MRTRQFLHATLLAAALFATVLGSASAQSCSGKKTKGCEVPETPYAAILPAVTMVGVAGLYILQRRRSSSMEFAEADANE